MKHTPTPWNYAVPCAYGTDFYSNDIWVGHTVNTTTGEEMAHNDAAFIVRACNAHDELVAVLSESIGDIQDIELAKRAANILAKCVEA